MSNNRDIQPCEMCGEFGAGVPESTPAAVVVAENPAKPASGHATKPGGPFRSELTPTGEQYVIPGCEKDAAPATKQLNLF
jgi:hypothetical protein